MKDNRLTPDNAVLLLVDHQAGLMQLVKDYGEQDFKNNVMALADIGVLFQLPTILSTSFETGPNGPILPELKGKFPKASFIQRPGQINAWDNEEFVQAIKKTGRKKLILAGIVTEVCVAFPTLSALEEGYEVYVVVDASGTFNQSIRDASLTRMAKAGAILVSWFALACELQKDWRNDAAGLAKLLSDHLVSYNCLIQSHKANK